jgi:hypothetical protein
MATLKIPNVHRTLREQNGKRQQRFVTKFFWLRKYRPRQIHQELLTTFGSDAYSEDLVQYWVAHFQSEDTSREDILRPDRALTDLAELFRLFLQNYVFASARMPSRHFSVMLQLQKRSLFAIWVWKNSLDDGYLIHCLTLKRWPESRHQMNCCRSSMIWRLILLLEL